MALLGAEGDLYAPTEELEAGREDDELLEGWGADLDSAPAKGRSDAGRLLPHGDKKDKITHERKTRKKKSKGKKARSKTDREFDEIVEATQQALEEHDEDLDEAEELAIQFLDN
jgi:hypothetical protein